MKELNNPKLIFLDIDGTLTPPGENTPPDSAVDAVKRAQKRGHRVFLCTGRNPDMLKPLLRYGFDGVISCAGGYVAVGSGEEEEVLFDCPMTDQQRDTALTSLHRNGVFCTIEAKGGSWGDENIDEFLKDQPEGNSEIERWRKVLAKNLGMKPMVEYDGSPIYKVVVMCLKMSQLDETRSLMSDEFQFVVQELKNRGGIINGEIFSKKFNKGLGVELIRKKFNAATEDTVGFGDSMNDLEMIQTVGTSVCMANGAEALKQMADLVCPSVGEDGLAWAFAKLNLV